MDAAVASAWRLDGGVEAGDGSADLRDSDLAGVVICAIGGRECAAWLAGWIPGAGDCGLGAGPVAGEGVRVGDRRGSRNICNRFADLCGAEIWFCIRSGYK